MLAELYAAFTEENIAFLTCLCASVWWLFISFWATGLSHSGQSVRNSKQWASWREKLAACTPLLLPRTKMGGRSKWTSVVGWPLPAAKYPHSCMLASQYTLQCAPDPVTGGTGTWHKIVMVMGIKQLEASPHYHSSLQEQEVCLKGCAYFQFCCLEKACEAK